MVGNAADRPRRCRAILRRRLSVTFVPRPKLEGQAARINNEATQTEGGNHTMSGAIDVQRIAYLQAASADGKYCSDFQLGAVKARFVLHIQMIAVFLHPSTRSLPAR